MKRWKRSPGGLNGRETETPRVDAFLREILEVEKRHGLSLSHEDSQGAFEVVTRKGENEWLANAVDATDEG